jgi:hypothetical protein
MECAAASGAALFSAAGAQRLLRAVVRWSRLRWVCLASVAVLVRELGRCVESDYLGFDPRRRCLELLDPLLVVDLSAAESEAWRVALGLPPVRGAPLVGDRSGTRRVPERNRRAFLQTFRGEDLVLHVLASLELLLGRARRAECRRGLLGCQFAAAAAAVHREAAVVRRCPVRGAWLDYPFARSASSRVLDRAARAVRRSGSALDAWGRRFGAGAGAGAGGAADVGGGAGGAGPGAVGGGLRLRAAAGARDGAAAAGGAAGDGARVL